MDSIITAFKEDDLGQPCWQFGDDAWIAACERDVASPEQRSAIEAHAEFKGWHEQCAVCASSTEHHDPTCEGLCSVCRSNPVEGTCCECDEDFCAECGGACSECKSNLTCISCAHFAGKGKMDQSEPRFENGIIWNLICEPCYAEDEDSSSD
jgi:hypothetical protein